MPGTEKDGQSGSVAKLACTRRNGWTLKGAKLCQTSRVATSRVRSCFGRCADIGAKFVGSWRLEIVKRSDQVKGFVVLPKRWLVERTLSWLTRCRRLVRHYEQYLRTSVAFIHLARIRLMLRRLVRT